MRPEDRAPEAFPMTSNIVHLEPDPHVAVQQLLPWYINGRLSAAEREQVDEHLAGCPACRAELDVERLWSAAPASLPSAAAVEAGWARMQARLATDAATAIESEPVRPAPVHAARTGWLGRRRAGARPPAAAPRFVPAFQHAWLVPGILSAGLAVALVWTLQ